MQILNQKLTFLDEILAFFLGHSFLVRGVRETVDKAGAGATQREALTHQGAAQRDLVHLTPFIRIPSADYQTSHQVVLVVVADLSHQVRDSFHARKSAQFHTKHIQDKY